MTPGVVRPGIRAAVPRVLSAIVIAASAAVAVAPVTPVLAADTLDQSSTAGGSFAFVAGSVVAGQTFTAGLTGSLNEVDVRVAVLQNEDGFDPASLSVALYATSGGVPTGSALASASVPVTGIDDGALHTVNVGLPASLSTAGTTYAIVLAAPGSPTDTAWLWDTASTDPYGGGTALTGNSGTNTWTIVGGSDDAFATYVDPVPCAAGYDSTTGYGPCTPASPGHFVATPGSITQSACDLGTFQANSGAIACVLAPVGTYVDTTGATQATACPAGTTTDHPGATSAADCHAPSQPPTIACAATPSTIWPPNGKLVPVTVTVSTTNATGFSLVSVTASEGVAADMAGWTTGTPDTSGLLRATRSGGALNGRTYTLTYRATNAAGDSATCAATVLVPHDQGGH